jgi:hypothetical protein
VQEYNKHNEKLHFSSHEREVAGRCYIMKVTRSMCEHDHDIADFVVPGHPIVHGCVFCKTVKNEDIFLGVFFESETYKVVFTSFDKHRSEHSLVTAALKEMQDL